MMNRCRDCRHWRGWDDIWDVPVVGTCLKILPSVLYADDEEPVDPDPHAAHVTDGASLSTGCDFGCSLFEAVAGGSE